MVKPIALSTHLRTHITEAVFNIRQHNNSKPCIA